MALPFSFLGSLESLLHSLLDFSLSFAQMI
jgi:hypothetical protein